MSSVWIDAVLDGTATPEQRAAVLALAETDPEVRRALAQGEAMLAALRALPLPEVPYDLVAAAKAEVRNAHHHASSFGALNHLVGMAPLVSWVMSPHRSRLFVPGVVVVTALVGVLGLAGLLGEGGPRRRALDGAPEFSGKSAPSVIVPSLVVREVTGRVLLRGPHQSERLVAIGDTMSRGARLRTEGGARISLQGEPRVTLELFESTAVSFGDHPPADIASQTDDATMDALASVKLETGTLRARTGAGARLEIHVEGVMHRLAIGGHEVHGGTDVYIQHRGEGGATVACVKGQVTVGERAVLRTSEELDLLPTGVGKPRVSGTTLVLTADLAPSAPGADAQVTVKGQTNPGALVTLDGIPAPVDEQGWFTATVPLKGSTQTIIIRARDVLVREQELALAVPAHGTPPPKLSPAPGGRASPKSRSKVRPADVRTNWSWETTAPEPG